jgi:UDP-GlcNAc3NAcA epimerase
MKIITILGARPQFVKSAVLSRKFAEDSSVSEILVHTGQHFDENMSEVFFQEMDIPKPKYNLGINSLSHGAMTGRMMDKIEEILIHERPDSVLVYGDTNSTIAGALAASKLGIKVAHVESGLRSFNMSMPEEINRILTDRISNLLFCPTKQALLNLEREGFPFKKMKMFLTGDIMLDAALYYAQQSEYKAKLFKTLPNKKFALATIHRQENTDDRVKLKEIIKALEIIDKDTQIILPLHPRTQKKIEEFGISHNLKVIQPLGYFDMLQLLKGCEIVFTDSGGLQKESFFFKKPCVTLRDETEWIELVENKVNILSKISVEDIIEKWKKIKLVKNEFFNINLYGSGNSAELIFHELLNY